MINNVQITNNLDKHFNKTIITLIANKKILIMDIK